jgi:hypothetical protein
MTEEELIELEKRIIFIISYYGLSYEEADKIKQVLDKKLIQIKDRKV